MTPRQHLDEDLLDALIPALALGPTLTDTATGPGQFPVSEDMADIVSDE